MYNFAKRLDGITGSAIRQIFALLADPELISFAGGNPSPKSFPSEQLSEIAKDLIKNQGATVLQYGNTVGLPSLIGDVVSMAKELSISCENKHVIITSGSTQGIGMATKAFINPGDTILTEDPTFIGALQTFFVYQANVKGVQTDGEGLVLDDLEAKIREFKPKFLYTIPTFQNPSGKTMSYDRRKGVYEICSKYGVLILEDDPYRAVRFTGEHLPPMKSFDVDHIVIYLMSMSKIISPGLRVGAAIAHEDIIAKLNICKQGEDVHTSNLSQAMVHEYLTTNAFAANLKSTIGMYHEQCQCMAECLRREIPGFTFEVPEGGLFIWGSLPEGTDATQVFKRAVTNKVAFVPGTHFYAGGGHLNTLRLNFSMSSVEQIEEGVRRLKRAID